MFTCETTSIIEDEENTRKRKGWQSINTFGRIIIHLRLNFQTLWINALYRNKTKFLYWIINGFAWDLTVPDEMKLIYFQGDDSLTTPYHNFFPSFLVAFEKWKYATKDIIYAFTWLKSEDSLVSLSLLFSSAHKWLVSLSDKWVQVFSLEVARKKDPTYHRVSRAQPTKEVVPKEISTT